MWQRHRPLTGFRIVLILALLCGQGSGLTHALTHVLQSASHVQQAWQGVPDSPDSDSNHCDTCDAYSQIATAIAASSTPLPGNLCDAGITPELIAISFFAALNSYSARAPPLSV